MNAQAADLNVTAADYLEQVHHATNATALLLSPSQIAWLGAVTAPAAVFSIPSTAASTSPASAYTSSPAAHPYDLI